MSVRKSAVDALTLYHDLWDLRLRAERMDRGFLVYLLEVALEDLQEELAAHEAKEQNDASDPSSGA